MISWVQGATLLVMLGTGMGMGLVYDLYTWFRKQFRPHYVIVFLCDLLYWLFFALFAFWVLFNVNDGRVRITVFVALILGGLLYFTFFSRSFIQVWEKIVQYVKLVARFIWRLITLILITPLTLVIVFIFTIFRTVFMFLWSIILWIFRFIKRIILALVHFLGTMIVSLFKKKKE